PDLRTIELRRLVGRIHKGESAALEELLRRSALRLEQLARAMLRRYPRVRQREQTGDVVQEAMLSFVGAVRSLPLSSTREFYGLAAEHIRRRLLDLARRHGRGGEPAAIEDVVGDAGRIASPEADEGELERWQSLHEVVASLPADQREVFGLRFYHGWA